MFDTPPKKDRDQQQYEVPLLTFTEQPPRPHHSRQFSNTRTLFGEPLTPVTSFNASLRSTEPVQSTHSCTKGFRGKCVIVLVWILIFIVATGVAVAAGAISMLLGNAILRAADYRSHRFTDDQSAAKIGAVGGSIAFVVVTILFYPCMNFFGLPFAVVIHGAASGGIGASILNSYQIEIGGIGGMNSAYAGTVGGCVVLVPVFIISVVLAAFFYVRSIDSNKPFRWPTFRSSK